MSAIPYFLRNPALDDQEQQPATMAPAAPQGMAASVVQHPMHAMIAPISAPAPKVDPMVAYESAQASKPATHMSAEEPAPAKMSAIDRYENALATKQMSDLSKDENPYGSENNHPGFFGKVLHGLSVATGGPNRRLLSEQQRNSQIEGIEKNKSEQALQGAQTAHAQQETAAGEPVEISPDQAQELESPELAGTKVSPAVLGALYKQRGINAQKGAANQLTNETRSDIAGQQILSKEKLASLKPEQRDDRAIAINQKLAEHQPISPEEQSYLQAYSKYIDQTKIQPGVARAAAYGQFRPVAAINPQTGEPEWNFSGQAVAQHLGTTASIPFRTAAGMAKFMTSGKGGQTITAYNTANDHLDLLGKAMDALQNGDVQGLNQLNNSFKQQFGSAAPTNVNAVKAMLAGELANVAKVTGATDEEIKEQKANINRAASPEQIKGFIDTNHDLMDQKAYEMYQQYQQGMQGQPAFGTGRALKGPGGAGAAPKVGDKKNGFTFDGTGWTK